MWLLTVFSLLATTLAFTPYVPTQGWTYYIEANRASAWPSCQYRFLSYPSSCDDINLWNGAGINQQVTLEPTSYGDSTFFLKLSCGKYLSYPGDCNQHKVDTWGQAGINQAFRFVPSGSGPFEYFLEAYGRQNCPFKWLSFPVACTSNKPDLLDLWSGAGAEQTFRIHPAATKNPIRHQWNSNSPCADPFFWYSKNTSKYQAVCTGGKLGLLQGDTIGPLALFKSIGQALGGSPPPWDRRENARWAPENIEVTIGQNQYNVIFFANEADDGKHRVGWSYSIRGPRPDSWDFYAPNFMDLGGAPGGDIDAHVFHDGPSYYLVWKTDDNNVGDRVTRIWVQQLSFSAAQDSSSAVPKLNVGLVGQRREVLDSTGLWWSDSWVSGGSLIEGPEVVKNGGYYYLFFASGKYCEASYMEGVARSTNIFGPYEKMLIPLLSTGIVGNVNNQKLLGPGHSSYLQDIRTQDWFTVFHASTGADAQCVRYPFITRITFANGWPHAEF